MCADTLAKKRGLFTNKRGVQKMNSELTREEKVILFGALYRCIQDAKNDDFKASKDWIEKVMPLYKRMKKELFGETE